jgi:UDP-N-acetylglucosamine:LPS N-acetylglucosamine transferase
MSSRRSRRKPASRRRAGLGLDPERPVGLVLFGGQGAAVMLEIAEKLQDHQLMLICGHNEKLRAKLGALPHRAPLFVEGFTREVPRYMQLADYFIGKPGPASISEAVAMHLPVIVECNAWTLPQERYNAVWVREQGVGVVLPNFRRIGRAVEEMLEPSRRSPASAPPRSASTIAPSSRSPISWKRFWTRVGLEAPLLCGRGHIGNGKCE